MRFAKFWRLCAVQSRRRAFTGAATVKALLLFPRARGTGGFRKGGENQTAAPFGFFSSSPNSHNEPHRGGYG